ncbi:MAG: type II secretion system protein [Patescibacteria group bacterium]
MVIKSIKPKTYNLKTSKGFTLMEVLIVSAILVILSSAIGITLFSYQRDTTLKSTEKDIINYLRIANQKAISGEDANLDGASEKWGIRFTNSTDDYYQLFYGNSFLEANTTEKIYLPTSLIFSDPSEGQNKDFIFNRVNGATTSDFVIISLLGDATQLKTITVNSNGSISGN